MEVDAIFRSKFFSRSTFFSTPIELVDLALRTNRTRITFATPVLSDFWNNPDTAALLRRTFCKLVQQEGAVSLYSQAPYQVSSTAVRLVINSFSTHPLAFLLGAVHRAVDRSSRSVNLRCRRCLGAIQWQNPVLLACFRFRNAGGVPVFPSSPTFLLSLSEYFIVLATQATFRSCLRSQLTVFLPSCLLAHPLSPHLFWLFCLALFSFPE